MVTTARGRRTPPANNPTVAVTGASGAVGIPVLRRLVAADGVGKVYGIDLTRPPAAAQVHGVAWRTCDIRDPGLVQKLSGVGVVVHCAVDRSPEAEPADRHDRNVTGTRTVVTAAAAAGVRRVVLVTSATVYGAAPDNPVPLDEDAPLRAEPEGLPADLLEIEDIAAVSRAIHPGLDVIVLRPAALAGPGIDTLVTRHFAAPRLLSVRDTEMRWQFCHVDDLAAAVEVAVLGRLDADSATVGCEGSLSQDEVAAVSGLRTIEVPATMAFATAERLHRAGVVPSPASELAYVAYPWVVPSTRLRAAGWRPQHDNTTALQALLDAVEGERAIAGRRLGVRDATIAGAGAAGATVAVLGAAAFVRRARRLRGR